MRRKYFHQIAISVDQVLNTLLAGWADETLSSRAYRCQEDKVRWKIVRKIIDIIFFWQDRHCMNSFINEIERMHLPPFYRREE